LRTILEVLGLTSCHAATRAWLLIFIFASPVSGCSAFFDVGLLFAGTACRCTQWHHSLFGITILQVYIYYEHYPEDKIQNRIVVCILRVFLQS